MAAGAGKEPFKLRLCQRALKTIRLLGPEGSKQKGSQLAQWRGHSPGRGDRGALAFLIILRKHYFNGMLQNIKVYPIRVQII